MVSARNVFPEGWPDRVRPARLRGVVRVAVAAAFLLAVASPAPVAEEHKYPRVSGGVLIEIQNDGTVASDDRAEERNDLFTTTEPEIVVHFTRGLSLTVHGVLEPVRDPDPGENGILDDHGLYVEDLRLDYEDDRFALAGGKFTPNFGRAWDVAPGIYGTDFAEDGYELAERIGFGCSVNFGTESSGKLSVSASLFFLDTSFLAESVITERPRNRRGDGGPSNTGKTTSVAVAVDGSIPPLAALEYHLAFVNQAKGQGDTADERGVAVALWREFAAGPVAVKPLLEYVHFANADALRDQARDILTVALGFGWQRWNAAAVYSLRDTDIPGGGGSTDQQFQLSVGYEFEFGLTTDIGWRVLEEENVTGHTLGVLLTHTFEF